MKLEDCRIERVPPTDARYPHWWRVFLEWKNFYNDGEMTEYIIGQGFTKKAAIAEAKIWMASRHFHEHMAAYEQGKPFPGMRL